MKNKLVALALSSVVLFGCSKSIDDFGDMNVNPNSHFHRLSFSDAQKVSMILVT